MVNSWRVQQAAREIRAGAVIAYPTEAVWGLGCDPWNEEAVDRLLASPLAAEGDAWDEGLEASWQYHIGGDADET